MEGIEVSFQLLKAAGDEMAEAITDFRVLMADSDRAQQMTTHEQRELVKVVAMATQRMFESAMVWNQAKLKRQLLPPGPMADPQITELEIA